METINKSEIYIWEGKNLTEQLKKSETNGVPDAEVTIKDIASVSSEKSVTDTTKKRESGIYKIINKIDGKYYVGCSRNIQSRWIRHKYVLRKNKHENKYLQRAWNKYGEENFEHVIVEITEPHLLPVTEQKYLDLCKLDKSNVYNLTFSTAFVPIKHNRPSLTVEHRKKLSIAHKSRDPKNYIGRKLSDETKRKISIAHLLLPKGSAHPRFGIPRSVEEKRRLEKVGEVNQYFIGITSH